jgi:hypothetical protein
MNKTIELQTFRPDNNSQDLSSTRHPLVSKKEDENRANSKLLTLERKYRKFNAIINLKKCMFFIYQNLIFDVLANIYHLYLLLTAITDILKIGLSMIYIIDYAISLWNAVLYLNIVIEYKQYTKELERKKLLQYKEEIRKIKLEDGDDSLLQVEIYLNKPLQGIRYVIIFRFLTWHIKYLCYIIVMATQDDFDPLEYFNIIVLLVDYYLYHLLKFYYFVLLRIEAYKTVFNFDDLE